MHVDKSRSNGLRTGTGSGPPRTVNFRIMASFNWFGEQEHRVFNYKPIYYNKEEDERRQMFGQADGTAAKTDENGNHVPGSYLQGAFRNGNYARRKSTTKAQSIIGIVALVLVVAVLIYMAKFFTLI